LVLLLSGFFVSEEERSFFLSRCVFFCSMDSSSTTPRSTCPFPVFSVDVGVSILAQRQRNGASSHLGANRDARRPSRYCHIMHYNGPLLTSFPRKRGIAMKFPAFSLLPAFPVPNPTLSLGNFGAGMITFIRPKLPPCRLGGRPDFMSSFLLVTASDRAPDFKESPHCSRPPLQGLNGFPHDRRQP